MKTEMRLSDAIMLGSTLLHHCQYAAGPSTDRGCAIQMALAAIGVGEAQRCDWHLELPLAWPWVNNFFEYPGEWNANGRMEKALTNIYTLNDVDLWSVERIADWVKSVEPAPVSETVTPVVEAVCVR